MKSRRSKLQFESNGHSKSSVNEDILEYESTEDESVIKISYHDNLQRRQSILFETFSDEEFELIDKLKRKLAELRERLSAEEK